MSDKIQSIENLIKSSKGGAIDEESVQSKFSKKQKEINLKELERQAKGEADSLGVSYVNLVGFPISPEAIALVSEKEARRLNALCFFYDGKNIRIAATDPENPEVKQILKNLEEKYHANGVIYLISRNSLEHALKIYESLPKITRVEKGVSISSDDLDKFQQTISNFKNLGAEINRVSITDVVTLILATALKIGSSDIHIEAEEVGIVIRLRVDGVLQEAAIIDKDKWNQIISRMKLLAKVKLNIVGKPQDGRFSIFLADEKVEVRTSFLPTNFGESVVMRLLRSGSIGLKFEELGLRPKVFEILQREIAKPNGLILTTGPTGSGKTTTLYSILGKLNKPETKIITLEDPVEYQLKGISQSQVDASRNYTFADGLRSVLRQDPDIVMVGEIRDLETAEIAIQASLTGHLVLSTLHTNDAAGVLPRLIDMGVKPYFMTPSINCIIGQRLIRKICPKCKVVHEITAEEKEKIDKILAVISPRSGESAPSELPVIYKAGLGCADCSGIGYKGRIGIYELFTMSNEIKKLATENAPAFRILEQAIEDGMLTMLQDGILKVLVGQTDLAEVYRVIGKTDYVDALYDVAISKTFSRGIKITTEENSLAADIFNSPASAHEKTKDMPASQMFNIIIASAILQNAGDIHIEPTETGVKIRFRIDGILHDSFDLSKEHYLPLLGQVKILIGVATNVKKATVDGRFSIKLGEQKMDSRVSIISGGYGETIVIRLLSSQAESLNMETLGMRPYTLKPISKSMTKTRGIIINTGPTGSGKTTTLYSILNKLNKPDVKIITVEDPIEYHLEGIMQTQINPEEGYTFAAAMRSLLRQNPNVMMIGEIRDEETAKTAIEASLTGHLVLSTIHANSAAGAIARFAGLGIPVDQLASALEITIGQRLARKLCPECKKEHTLTESEEAEVKSILESIDKSAEVEIPTVLKTYEATGCSKCNNIGYKGRLGVYEAIEFDQELQKIIQEKDITASEIEQVALKHGMVTMAQDGVLKALSGETSLDEIFRVVK